MLCSSPVFHRTAETATDNAVNVVPIAADVPTTSGAPTTTVLRVSGVTIKSTTFESIAPEADQVTVFWRLLDQCVLPAEQRARARLGSDHIPAALRVLEANFSHKSPQLNTSILVPLTTQYPMLVRSLQVLVVTHSCYGESAALDAFAALATHLTALTFWNCSIQSVRALAGRCEYLRTLDLWGCGRLGSLEGVADHAYLEEVTVTRTPILSIEPLRTCPALKVLFLNSCRQLASLDGLEYHQRLQEVYAAETPITSVEPLCTCPALTRVDFSYCKELASIEALEGHQRLREVDASCTAITSIKPLQTCPVLKTVYLRDCGHLPGDGDVELSSSVRIRR